MKKLAISSLALFLLVFSTYKSKAQKKIPNRYIKTAIARMNVKCPFMIDAEIRLDSVREYNNYLFTLYNTAVHNTYTPLGAKKFEAAMKKRMNDTYTKDPRTKIFRDNKVAIAYNYKDKNGNFLCYFVCRGK